MNVTDKMILPYTNWRKEWVSGYDTMMWTDGVNVKEYLPDFTTDLNLVHEVEVALTDTEWYKYTGILSGEEQYPETITYRKMLTHATAQQKCNALYGILKERK